MYPIVWYNSICFYYSKMEENLQPEQSVSRTRETSVTCIRGGLLALSGIALGYAFDRVVGVRLSENVRALTWVAPMMVSFITIAGRVAFDKIFPQFEDSDTEITVRDIYYALSHVDTAVGSFAFGAALSHMPF
jgi:hypothetical protein